MSGFGDEKELIHDLSIAATIPGTGGQGFATGAVGAYALKKVYRVLFDDKTSTWRDGKGNIVPPPSERGELNRVFTRGMMVETGAAAVRPYYDAKRRKWTDTSKDLPDLNSDDSNVVEGHLGKTLAQFQVGMAPEYKHHFTKDELAFIRKHYESTARGKKPIPVKSDSDAITKYKTFMDYIRDKAPDGMFGRGVRGRVSAELHSRRSAGAESASEGDANENFSRVESRRRAGAIADRKVRPGDAPPRPVVVSPAHAPFMTSVDANILAPAEESFERPVNRVRDDPGHDQFFGDDVPGVSVEEAFERIPANRRSALGIWHVGHGRYYSDSEWKDVTEIARELAAYEASGTSTSGRGQWADIFHGEDAEPVAMPVPAPRPELREVDAGPPAPVDDPVELVDNREPDRREESIYRPHEVEVNDAPGAPYQGPGYFDVDPPKDVGVVPLGREYQSPFALLHEEQVETNRKRRYHTRVIAAESVTPVYLARCGAHYANYGGAIGSRWARGTTGIAHGNLASVADDAWHLFARQGLLWLSSSSRALVPAHMAWTAGTLDVQFTARGPDASVFSATGEPSVAEAYAENFLTYVPPGPGVSQRLGRQVFGNYLQMRLLFSPAVYIPEQLVRNGKVVAEALPYSSVPVEFTSSGWPSSSRQYLFTVHRFIVVLTSNPLLEFKDVVVDEFDVHSPISLHIRGAHEILKDSFVDGDRDISLSVNVQLKQRPFYYTSLSPPEPIPLGGPNVPSGAPPAELRATGLTRGYHVLCLYASAVVSLPLDLYFNFDASVYESRLEKGTIPPRCHMSYAFSFSDA